MTMTKEQFLKHLHDKDRDYVRRGWIALALLIMSVAMMCFAQRFEGNPVISKLLYGIVALCMIVGTIILLFWDLPRGVRCPSCRVGLFKTAAQITTATGNCPYCGEKVFEPSVEKNKS